MGKTLNYILVLVGYPLVMIALFNILNPEIKAFHNQIKHDVAVIFSIVLAIVMCLFMVITVMRFSETATKQFSFWSIIGPAIAFFGTLICFHLEYTFKGHESWGMILFILWWIIKILLPIANIMILSIPACNINKKK